MIFTPILTPIRYLSSIEERLKVVENRLFSLGTLTPPASSGPENSEPPGPLTQENGSEPGRVECAIERACVTEDTENLTSTEDSIDGMGAVTFEPEEDCAFFGPSSNIALLRDISHAVARIGGHTRAPWVPSLVAERSEMLEVAPPQIPVASPPSSLRYSFSDPYNSRANVSNDQKINIYSLPPEPLARELIRRYFSNTGQLFPYIHEQTFIEQYNQMKLDNFRSVRRMWLGLLNMVFAMATSVSLSPDGQVSGAAKRAAESDIYYRRASGLCSEQIALGKGMSLDAGELISLLTEVIRELKLKTAQFSTSYSWASTYRAHRSRCRRGLPTALLSK
jgi:hypothetical protein